MTTLRVRGGELVDVGSWVYVWVKAGRRRGPVVYVGATGLPPAVRTWLHLHDSDPKVGRVAGRYRDLAREDLDVLAFAVPDGLSRQLVKAALVRELEREGLVAEDYVGDASDPHALPDEVVGQARQFVVAVLRAVGPDD
jgi:hypothetical protein